jgi:hypothetical protein
MQNAEAVWRWLWRRRGGRRRRRSPPRGLCVLFCTYFPSQRPNAISICWASLYTSAPMSCLLVVPYCECVLLFCAAREGQPNLAHCPFSFYRSLSYLLLRISPVSRAHAQGCVFAAPITIRGTRVLCACVCLWLFICLCLRMCLCVYCGVREFVCLEMMQHISVEELV